MAIVQTAIAKMAEADEDIETRDRGTARSAGMVRAKRSRQLMHPLCGADIGTLLRVLAGNGGVAPWAVPQAAIALVATIGRLPFTLAERAYVAGKLRAAGDMPAPIFIIGHWRSGTTHLFNILSQHKFGYVAPLAAGMPWDSMGLVAALRPILEGMLPKERFIDAIPVAPDSPQEDEVPLANMNPLSFYHGIYFPKRFEENFARGIVFEGCSDREIRAWTERFIYFSRKTWLASGRRRLLVKNPVYTARIAAIREIWPDAKFIHCIRNPFEVFVSMRNFYAKLFAEFALQPHGHVDIDRIVLDGYDRLMGRFLAEQAGIPAGNLYELRYERLSGRPLDEIEMIYKTLGLSGFNEAKPSYRSYLDSVRSYERNRYDYAREDRAKVEEAWHRYVAHWGYAPPSG